MEGRVDGKKDGWMDGRREGGREGAKALTGRTRGMRLFGKLMQWGETRGLVVDRVRVLLYYIVLPGRKGGGGIIIWHLRYGRLRQVPGAVACIIVATVIVVRSGGYCKSRVS